MKRDARYYEIMDKVDAYNREQKGKEGYLSPFIAEVSGRAAFERVAAKIGVPPEELSDFLGEVNKDLPPVGE